MQLVRKTIRLTSQWYLQLWESISGKTQKRIYRLQERLDASRQNTYELEQQLRTVNHQLAELHQRYDQVRQREEDLQQSHFELEQQLQETKHQLVELRQDYGRSQQRQAELEQQLQASQAQYEQTEQSFSAAVASLEESLKQSKKTTADLEARWNNTNNKYIALQEEQAALQREYKAFINLSDNEVQSLESDLAKQQLDLGICYVELSRTQAQVMAEATDSDDSPPAPPPLDLSAWKIAMVGGHENMTHGVSEKLQQQYNLKELIKIPPEHVPQQQLRQKLEHCDLVVLIVGYINHPLTYSIGDLKSRNALKGEVLPVNSLGVSGVMRELLSFLETTQDGSEPVTD